MIEINEQSIEMVMTATTHIVIKAMEVIAIIFFLSYSCINHYADLREVARKRISKKTK